MPRILTVCSGSFTRVVYSWMSKPEVMATGGTARQSIVTDWWMVAPPKSPPASRHLTSPLIAVFTMALKKVAQGAARVHGFPLLPPAETQLTKFRAWAGTERTDTAKATKRAAQTGLRRCIGLLPFPKMWLRKAQRNR